MNMYSNETLMEMTNQELTDVFNEMTGHNVAKWKKAKGILVSRILEVQKANQVVVVSPEDEIRERMEAIEEMEANTIIMGTFVGPVMEEPYWKDVLNSKNFRFQRDALVEVLQVVVDTDGKGRTVGLTVNEMAEFISEMFDVNVKTAKGNLAVLQNSIKNGKYKKTEVVFPETRPHGRSGMKIGKYKPRQPKNLAA